MELSGICPYINSYNFETYESKKIENEIVTFVIQEVRCYLKPYFSGKIKQEDQNMERKPIYWDILGKLLQKFDANEVYQRKIEVLIFNAYVFEAAADFTLKLLPKILNPQDPSQEEQKEVFYQAISEAMKFDFTEGFRSSITNLPDQLNLVLYQFYKLRIDEREAVLGNW